MNLIEQVKKLHAPMFVVFVGSKVIVGIGLGVLLANYLVGFGWWILLLGVVLSIIAAAKAISVK